jgi:hypothetical protein
VFDTAQSKTSIAVRAEDQPLIKAVNDTRRLYPFSDTAAEQLVNDFTNPKPALRRWIFELCDPAPRTSPFANRDCLAAFTRDVLTSGQDQSARWADLTTSERRQARRIERYAQDKRRVRMGAGRPQSVDRAVILYVLRRIEETIGDTFRFSRPGREKSLGGPMLRLAEAALRRLFLFADRAPAYLGLVSPARYYKRAEIAFTAELARRSSGTSPAKWHSDWILSFTGDVRSELVRAGRQRRPHKRPMMLVAERILFDPPASPPPVEGQGRLKFPR